MIYQRLETCLLAIPPREREDVRCLLPEPLVESAVREIKIVLDMGLCLR
jgi:hypothetical protein